MQRWEYCVITGVKVTGIGSFEGKYPKLYYFSLAGIDRKVDLGKSSAKTRPDGFEKVTEGGYIAATIARLGNDGWEMVGTGSHESFGQVPPESHCIYFRRLKE